MKLAAIWYLECQNEPSVPFFLELPGSDLEAELLAHYREKQHENYLTVVLFEENEPEPEPTITVQKNAPNGYAEYTVGDGDGVWLFASTEGWQRPQI